LCYTKNTTEKRIKKGAILTMTDVVMVKNGSFFLGELIWLGKILIRIKKLQSRLSWIPRIKGWAER